MNYFLNQKTKKNILKAFKTNNIKNNKNNENINASLQENSNETYRICLNKALKLLDHVFYSLSLNKKIGKLISLSKKERREAHLDSLFASYLIC